ncbi:MAG: hypothetical protein EPN97_05760 [Alphaproteobacteria bacterium]|nr:MAG: hypothetical protein EPN97_05760 [Alphaproteobacteria bacterium]
MTSDIDPDSQREVGVFQSIFKLRDAGKLGIEEEKTLDTISRWFDKNLAKPTRFTASKPPYYRKKSKAISWFKDSAGEHILRVNELIVILKRHGISVRVVKAARVGYVTYEDEYQIVAEPFSDTPR